MSFFYILKNAEQDVKRPGDMLMEIGTKAFVTTGATVEVSTNLTECTQAFLTPSNATTYDVDDQLSTDKAITTGAITVGRGSSGTSALEFDYMFIGRKVA